MNKIIKLGIGILISGLGLYFAFHQLDFDELVHNLSQVNMPLVLMASGIMIFSVWIRALRWGHLLNRSDIRRHHLFASTMIGYFGNSVLPFRLGEALRAYDITTKEKVKFSESVGTIILERILDLVGLVLVIGLFVSVYPLGLMMNRWAWVLIIGVLVLFVTVTWVPKPLLKVQDILNRWHPSTAILTKLKTFLSGTISSLNSLRGNPHALGLTFNTLFLWLLYYTSLYIITVGVGISLTWDQVGILLISTTLSIMIPAAPGYVGTYHAVAILVLNSMFNIPLAESQAVAIILHAMGTLPYILIGAVYFFFSTVRISDIKSGVNPE